MTKTNFKTMAKLLAAVVVVAALGGACTKEMAPDPTTIRLIRNINATATMPQQSMDKACLHTSDRKVFWQPNDTISINGTAIRTHSIDPNDSTKAEFTGTIGAYMHGGKDCYWAVYPTSIRSSSSESGLVVSLPSSQTYNSSSPLNGSTYMAAHTDANPSSYYIGFEMRNLVTVLRLRLVSSNASNRQLKKIEVYHSTQKLCGTSSTITNPATAMVMASGKTSLTVNCTDGTNGYITLNSTDSTDVYIALPPLAGSGTLTVRTYNTDDQYTQKSVTLSSAMNRNTIYKAAINADFAVIEGKYTVNQTNPHRQVVFSPGNLQWSSSGTHAVAGGGTAAGTWRFAPNQWDTIGAGNNYPSSSHIGWMDLFGWGTSGYGTSYPYLQTSQTADYAIGDVVGDICETNYDWGVYNAIINPVTSTTDDPGTWRTLTKNEWNCLLKQRSASTVNGISNARYARGTVNGVSGLILFPDIYTHPSGVTLPTNINTANTDYSGNSYSGADWTKMEEAGVVFLPAAGSRGSGSENDLVKEVNNWCNYWSSTGHESSNFSAYFVQVLAIKNVTIGFTNRFNGRSVRLAKNWEL